MSTIDEADQIRRTRLASNRAIHDRDLDGVAAIWMDDCHVTTSEGEHVVGRGANRQKMAELLRTRSDLSYVRTPNDITVNGATGMAAEQGRWQGSWTEAGRQTTKSGPYFAQWSRAGGRWQIRAEVFVQLED